MSSSTPAAREAVAGSPAASTLQAVLFDLDGTLVDTEPYWLAAEQSLAADHGGTWTTEQGVACVGRPVLESAQRLRIEGGVDLAAEEIVDRLLAAVVRRVRDEMPWQPGVRDLLDGLGRDGVPLGLVTMSYRPLAEALLAALPERTFQVVVTGDEVRRGKPDPEPYLTAAARLGVEPARCVVVEDSPPGISSGLAAGCAVVAVPHIAPVEHFRDTPGVTMVDTLKDLDTTRIRTLVLG